MRILNLNNLIQESRFLFLCLVIYYCSIMVFISSLTIFSSFHVCLLQIVFYFDIYFPLVIHLFYVLISVFIFYNLKDVVLDYVHSSLIRFFFFFLIFLSFYFFLYI